MAFPPSCWTSSSYRDPPSVRLVADSVDVAPESGTRQYGFFPTPGGGRARLGTSSTWRVWLELERPPARFGAPGRAVQVPRARAPRPLFRPFRAWMLVAALPSPTGWA